MEGVEVSHKTAACCWKCAGSGILKFKGLGNEKSPCGPCNGSGKLHRKDARITARRIKEFAGWPSNLGPSPTESNTYTSKPEEEWSYFSGKWRILQRTNAHRYSTDDVVTSWVAWRVGRALGLPLSSSNSGGLICDIGCGLGSVLLMNAWLHPHAKAVVGAEVQSSRFSLAQRSIAFNLGSVSSTESGVDATAQRLVAAVLGDLRDAVTHQALSIAAGADENNDSTSIFSLVTGTPPYFDMGADATPPNEESARCLFEYRGGIEAYCAAAAALLAPGGAFCVCESSLSLQRAYDAAAAAGLSVLSRVDVVPAPGKPPLFFVLVCGRAEESTSRARASLAAGAFDVPLPLVDMPHDDMRHEEGAFASYYNDAARSIRADIGAETGDNSGIAKHIQGAPHSALQGISLVGETVTVLHVRAATGGRTPQFRLLLAELGKPSD